MIGIIKYTPINTQTYHVGDVIPKKYSIAFLLVQFKAKTPIKMLKSVQNINGGIIRENLFL
jgi:hypothetical protein